MAQSVKADLMCGRQALGDMATEHTTHFVDAAKMNQLENGCINLVVTSPPYPMVEMWDEIFAKSDPKITNLLADGDGWGAFERMHKIIDKIWAECHRVTSAGGFVCINIGDATRTIGGEFALYTNRARIDMKMIDLGFTPLPSIIWQKVSNSATAFMGSGMLPAGAYVAHGHEHILIYRKGGKRQFKSAEEKQHRRESAFFWEERNVWFSDVWNFTGTRQKLSKSAERERSAAYPFELPFRLIAMYSVKGDTILDPFMGTGSTHAAAMALGRNSVGYEIDSSLKATIEETKVAAVEWGRKRQRDRLNAHAKFIDEREKGGKEVKHFNEELSMKVMTSQETFAFYGEWDEASIKEIKKTFKVVIDSKGPCWERVDGRHLHVHKFEPFLNMANRRGSSVIGPKTPVGNLNKMLRDLKLKNTKLTYEDWEEYYFNEGVDIKGERTTKNVLNKQAKELQKRVQKLLDQFEWDEEIPLKCIEDYVENMVLGSTWDGIMVGEQNLKQWLKEELDLEIVDPPGDSDTEHLVDVCVKVGSHYIGIQVKPDTFRPQNKADKEEYSKKHKEFEEKYGGKVFWGYYYSKGENKLEVKTPSGSIIGKNKDLLNKIKAEIERLKKKTFQRKL